MLYVVSGSCIHVKIKSCEPIQLSSSVCIQVYMYVAVMVSDPATDKSQDTDPCTRCTCGSERPARLPTVITLVSSLHACKEEGGREEDLS